MTGADRAEARLLERFAIPCPPGRVTRQQLRQAARQNAKPRPSPKYGFFRNRDKDDLHILRKWLVGGVEFAFHATKGLRRRRVNS